jgi:hypothetical protein
VSEYFSILFDAIFGTIFSHFILDTGVEVVDHARGVAPVFVRVESGTAAIDEPPPPPPPPLLLELELVF